MANNPIVMCDIIQYYGNTARYQTNLFRFSVYNVNAINFTWTCFYLFFSIGKNILIFHSVLKDTLL